MKKYFILTFILSFIIFYLFYYSNETYIITKENIDLFLYTLIPNLYPYILFLYLFILLKCHLIIGYLLQFISIPLFGISGKSLSIVLIGLLGGYPLIALLASEIINEENKDELNKLIPLFSFPSIAFLFNIIFNNIKFNLFIFYIFVALIILYFIKDKTNKKYLSFKEVKQEFSIQKIDISLISKTFTKSINSLLLIFSNLLFFSLFKVLINFNNEKINNIFLGLIEFSKSSIILSKNVNSKLDLIILSFILLFGGLSVNMQICNIYNNKLLNIKKYYKYRFILIILILLLIYIY